MHAYCIQTYGYKEGKQQLLLLLKGRLVDIFEQDQYRCLQHYQYLIDYDVYWCIPGFQHGIILKLIIYRLHLLQIFHRIPQILWKNPRMIICQQRGLNACREQISHYLLPFNTSQNSFYSFNYQCFCPFQTRNPRLLQLKIYTCIYLLVSLYKFQPSHVNDTKNTI